MTIWNLDHYDAFFVDVDGVLLRGGQPIDKAASAFRALQAAGQVLILTNNSTRTREQQATRLSDLGFNVRPGEVVCSSYVMAEYLRKTHGPVSVWTVGESGLTDELLASGHRIASNPADAQWVVAGMDRSITHQKLVDALQALDAGARLAATNQDRTFPSSVGPMPGAGAIIGAFAGMGFEPDVSVGKPDQAFYDMALSLTDVAKDRILMIGDRLETDILGGTKNGLDSLLVLTGISTRSVIEQSDVRPTWIADSLAAAVAGNAIIGDRAAQ